jgi:uncharacterized GH25 family protein
MRKSYYLAIVLLFAFVSLTFSMAGGGGGASQKTHRGFQGKITDQDGNPLKGVEIILITASEKEVTNASDSKKEKSLNTSTGKNGQYRFIAVRHGQYRVRYSLDGYQTLEKLIEFKRGSKDAVLNIELKRLEQPVVSSVSGPN